MVGITKCCQLSLPDTGSQCSEIENSITSSSAKKKFGSAWPTTAVARQARSIQLFLNTAASTPSGTDTSKARPNDARPSASVTWSLDQISGPTSVLK